MASGPQQHQQQHHQQQQHHHQQQHQQEHLIQQNNQMQFASNQVTGMGTCFDPQQQQLHQINTMSPISAPMSIDNTQGHMISMNPHHQQPQMMGTIMNPTGMIGQDPCNQSTSHDQQQCTPQQQHQKSQLLPLLLSPPPHGLKSSPTDQSERVESDHDQIIEQVISLENEYSDSSGTMANAENQQDVVMSHQHQQQPQQQQQQHQQQQQQQQQQPQQQQQRIGDINITGASCIIEANQLSNSSEDLLNILLELDREPSNIFNSNQQLDLDEKAGIENIRKQLMSCEVQSDQNTNSMSPILQMNCQPQTPQHPQPGLSIHKQHQQQHQQHIMPQIAPVISHHQQQQPHHLSSPGLSQQQQSQHRLSVDQTLLQGSYSSIPVSAVPVSSSSQSYAPHHQQQQQQHHQNVARISQSNPMTIVNNSPSPSWQQPQLSPYSPQQLNSQQTNNRTTSATTQRQNQQQQQQQQPMIHQTTTSPQMQQLHHHHPLQRGSPSQSVSPPATTEPSPVVKKNPLLNAQLVNNRPPSITPTRFLNNQTNVLNQNPILNAKLSQSPFVTNSGGVGVGTTTVSSPVNQVLNSQPRFVQQQQQQQQQAQQSSNYNYDITQQQQQSNAQQQTPPQQTGHMSMFTSSDQQQQQQQQQQPTNQIFRSATAASTTTIPNTGMANLGTTSPTGGGLSQQVKQEIRRKVQQQPKREQHTTSLLKQLLSDDHK